MMSSIIIIWPLKDDFKFLKNVRSLFQLYQAPKHLLYFMDCKGLGPSHSYSKVCGVFFSTNSKVSQSKNTKGGVITNLTKPTPTQGATISYLNNNNALFLFISLLHILSEILSSVMSQSKRARASPMGGNRGYQ